MHPALSINGLRKVYANGVEAIKGIDLEVAQRDFFALLGPNGAGKSTTIGIINSLIRKTAGTIDIFGISIDEDFARAKLNIGVMPQEFNFNAFERTMDIVVTQAGYYGIPHSVATERAEHDLKLMGLWEKRHTRAIALSGGMKRRLMIARSIVHRPKLLILDEPTAGVDIDLRRLLWELLRTLNSEGTTIILTTHYLEEAEHLCRNVAIIDHGTIIQNTSIRELLKLLQREVFVMDLISPLVKTEDWSYGDAQIHIVDSNTLKVNTHRDQSLNDIFNHLNENGIQVSSMRPQSNRLEELFLSLTRSDPP